MQTTVVATTDQTAETATLCDGNCGHAFLFGLMVLYGTAR